MTVFIQSSMMIVRVMITSMRVRMALGDFLSSSLTCRKSILECTDWLSHYCVCINVNLPEYWSNYYLRWVVARLEITPRRSERAKAE